jgi:hypothetical protein
MEQPGKENWRSAAHERPIKKWAAIAPMVAILGWELSR